MSYDVSLWDNKQVVKVPRHEEGGTYAVGCINTADLNITFNYANQYAKHNFSIKDLDNQFADNMIEIMNNIVLALGTVRDEDYWKSTPGNAGYALNILLGWARENPDAMFRVSY